MFIRSNGPGGAFGLLGERPRAFEPVVAFRARRSPAAAERADELRTGAVRDPIQIQPGIAAGVHRLIAERVHSLLASATIEQPDDNEKRKPVVVSERARRAYGLPRPTANQERPATKHDPAIDADLTAARLVADRR